MGWVVGIKRGGGVGRGRKWSRVTSKRYCGRICREGKGNKKVHQGDKQESTVTSLNHETNIDFSIFNYCSFISNRAHMVMTTMVKSKKKGRLPVPKVVDLCPNKMSLTNRVEERRDGSHVSWQENQRKSVECPPGSPPPPPLPVYGAIFADREETCCGI